MRIIVVFTILSILIVSGCASTGTSRDKNTTLEQSHQFQDSSALNAYDKLFTSLHGKLIVRIDELLLKDATNEKALEAESMLEVAEELYLEGKVKTAINILQEANKILEQAN